MSPPARAVRTSLIAAAALAALAVASPGQAAVHYLYELIAAGGGPVLGSFAYTTADFITADLNVPAASLDSCTPFATATCGIQEFHISSVGFVSGMGDSYDIIGFKNVFPSSSSTSFHYFANGAFGAVGVYEAMVLTADGSRLTVTQDPVDGVPEPATWAMLVLGFGAAGAALRGRARRRVATA